MKFKIDFVQFINLVGKLISPDQNFDDRRSEQLNNCIFGTDFRCSFNDAVDCFSEQILRDFGNKNSVNYLASVLPIESQRLIAVVGGSVE